MTNAVYTNSQHRLYTILWTAGPAVALLIITLIGLKLFRASYGVAATRRNIPDTATLRVSIPRVNTPVVNTPRAVVTDTNTAPGKIATAPTETPIYLPNAKTNTQTNVASTKEIAFAEKNTVQTTSSSPQKNQPTSPRENAIHESAIATVAPERSNDTAPTKKFLASSVEVNPSTDAPTVKTSTILAPAVFNVWSIAKSELGQFFSFLLQKIAWLFGLLWKFLQAIVSAILAKSITKIF